MINKKQILLKEIGKKFSEEELKDILENIHHNERKLSIYGKELCEAAKKVLPYARHYGVYNDLYKAIKNYNIALKIL